MFTVAAGTGRDDRVDEGTDKLTDPVTGDSVRKAPQAQSLSSAPAVRLGSLGVRGSTRQGDPPQRPLRSLHRGFRPGQSRLSDWRRSARRPPVPDRKVARLRDWRRHQPAAGGRCDQVRRAGQPPQARDSRYRRRCATTATVIDGFEQGSQSQRNETIGRLNWTRANLRGFTFEAGAEVALNTLDYQNDLFILGPGGARDPDRPADRRRHGQGNARRSLCEARQAGDACVPHRRRAQLRTVEPQGARRHQRRPKPALLQAEPDARLEAGRRLAFAVHRAAHRRPARTSSISSVRRN